MTITIRTINADPHRDILEPIYTTKGKDYIGQHIRPESLKKMYMAEHSVIENLRFYISVKSINKDIRNQIVRHTKTLPRYYCKSSRPDWTGKPRDPNEPVNFDISINPLGLIQMSRQRLCRKTEINTRLFMNELVSQIAMSEDMFINNLTDYLVPDCVYRGECTQGGCDKC